MVLSLSLTRTAKRVQEPSITPSPSERTCTVEDEDEVQGLCRSMRMGLYERLGVLVEARSDAQLMHVPEIVRSSGMLPLFVWSV